MKADMPAKRLEATPELAAARIASRADYASYKWWLLQYGAGYLGGYELNGLCDDLYGDVPPDVPVIGDIVALAELHERTGQPGKKELELLSLEGDEIYYFDTTRPDRTGEYPIMCRDVTVEEDEVFAGNFYEFLIKLIPAKK